jgi:hypothetical protein
MDQRTLDFSASQLFRVLFSDASFEGLRDYFAQLILSIYAGCDAVATVVPTGIREDELLETAAKQRFDLAILILNNILCAPYYLPRRRIMHAADGVFLIRRMICLFKVPIIALYGWPDDPLYPAGLLEAGAAAALKLPCPPEEIKQALQHSLVWSAPDL